MQSSVRYLQDLVRSGGPESDQYETLNQTFVDFNQLARQGEFDHYGPDFKEDLMGTSFGYDTMQGYVYRQPHGHSGDFELYERIYGNYQTPNKDLEKWDQFWNKQAFVSALQNSQRYFNQTLADTEASSTNTNVLNVASGSSRFVADYLKLNQSATTFHCMDQSHRALDYARLLCRGHLHQVQFQQGQVAELAQDIRYDLVWSEGLFDYLSDREFKQTLEKLLSMMNKNGQCVIGNLSTENPNQAFMEFMQWHVNPRSEAHLRSLASACGIKPANMHVVKEASGVNLFLHITR